MADSFEVGSGHCTPRLSLKIKAPAEAGVEVVAGSLALGVLAAALATLLATLAGFLGLLPWLLSALTTLLATVAGLLRLLARLFVRVRRVRVIHLELLRCPAS
jgi:hypothetical protein